MILKMMDYLKNIQMKYLKQTFNILYRFLVLLYLYLITTTIRNIRFFDFKFLSNQHSLINDTYKLMAHKSTPIN